MTELTIEQVETIVLLIHDPFWQVSGLEPDERLVLKTIARGGTVAHLANQLEVNPRTVYRISRRGLRKLNHWIPGNQEYGIEDLTALAFQMLEQAARLEAD